MKKIFQPMMQAPPRGEWTYVSNSSVFRNRAVFCNLQNFPYLCNIRVFLQNKNPIGGNQSLSGEQLFTHVRGCFLFSNIFVRFSNKFVGISRFNFVDLQKRNFVFRWPRLRAEQQNASSSSHKGGAVFLSISYIFSFHYPFISL